MKIKTVKRTDADAVVTAFGVLLGSYDAEIDNSVSDAARRAAVLATPSLAAQLREQRSGPSPDWGELTDHHAYTTVTVQLGGGGATPPDKATSGVRMITLSVQPHGDHRWQPKPSDQTLLVFLHRERPKKPWSISKFSYLS